MNVLAITIADPETGSTKYRVHQYRDLLAENGMSLATVRRHAPREEFLARVAEADVVLNQKCLLGSRRGRCIWRRTNRVLFDFDDAIYTRPGRPRSLPTRLRVYLRMRYWLRRSMVVVAANEYLATYARRFARRVEVIPMGLDLDAWSPAAEKLAGRVVVGWAGAPVNLPRIESLGPALQRVVRRHPNVEFRVYSGGCPQLPFPFTHVPYAPGTEPEFVRQLDIGLLPLTDEEHSRGKSPIKSIQYLACGVPVVGNVMGATHEICTPDSTIAVGQGTAEWESAICSLVEDPERRRRLGAAGRQHVLPRFCAHANGALLLRLLREIGS
ncbi:MAG: glycosyltransferase [Victivallales bacterium]|jgi:glycosyltransferase involved in cell wall biosynthesis|nr:glycosyltransferase [Victivallales bacterium]